MVLALAALTMCSNDDVGENTASTTKMKGATAGSQPGADFVPPESDAIIAATTAGEVVELSPDGHARRVILGPEATGGPPGHLGSAANGRSIYFDRGRQGCWEEFSYTGDDPDAVGGASGAWPTPSPDRRSVAVVRGPDPCHPDRIAVLGPHGASPREWVMSADAGFVQGPLSWSSDSGRLAYVVRNGDGTRVEILDMKTGNELRGAPVMPSNEKSSVAAAFFIDTSEGEGLTLLEAHREATTPKWSLARRSQKGDATLHADVPEPRDISVTRAGAIAIVTMDERLLAGSELKMIGDGFVTVVLPPRR